MWKKLNNYRKLNGLSKKELASKLSIELEKYRQIEKDKEIPEGLKEKINELLESKEEKKTAQIELPKGLTDMSSSLNQMIKFSNPLQAMIDKTNAPLRKSLSLQSIAGAINPSSTALDYLKDINSKRHNEINVFGGIANFSTSIDKIAENNQKAYNGLQFVFGNQSKSISSVIDMQKGLLEAINKPTDLLKSITSPMVFQTISDKVNRNKNGYESYIGLSAAMASTLSNSALSGSTFSNFFSLDSFIKTEKVPSTMDFLSGSSFTLFDDTETFEEEREIIEQIDNDPELKEQANNFFEELNQIINDDSSATIDEEKFENIYSRFVNWISATFNKSEAKAQRIAHKIFKMFPLILSIISISFAYTSSINNKANHKKSQIEIQQTNDDIKGIENKQDQYAKSQSEGFQEILNRINSGSLTIMVALKDANLWTRRSSKSKIIDIVSASQKVNVIQKKVKWMEVIYKDANDGTPKTGWVRIVDFEVIKK